ncbi:MAG: L-rhamnose mutarotase [Bacteroidota bacterium]|nr:L-rhamnose mutarotase [Bacteroidota bacterium]
MKRFGQMIKLKPEGAAEYKRLHMTENIWPGVNEMIKKCNIARYSIYCKDDFLFAYFEYTGINFEADMAMMAADPLTQKWWDTVKPLMQPLDTIKPDEFWADMDEIYHLD